MHMRALIIKNERIQTLHLTNEIKSLAFIEISSNKNVAKLSKCCHSNKMSCHLAPYVTIIENIEETLCLIKINCKLKFP